MPSRYSLVVSQKGQEVVGEAATVFSGGPSDMQGDTRGMPCVRFTSAADWLEFQRHVAQWKTETAYQSMIEDMVLSESYQRIIGMGARAIPLIIWQIEIEGSNPDHWWWALRVLAQHDPVPAEHKGNVAEMAKRWVEWYRENQLAS
jgi:hypothetical protein